MPTTPSPGTRRTYRKDTSGFWSSRRYISRVQGLLNDALLDGDNLVEVAFRQGAFDGPIHGYVAGRPCRALRSRASSTSGSPDVDGPDGIRRRRPVLLDVHFGQPGHAGRQRRNRVDDTRPRNRLRESGHDTRARRRRQTGAGAIHRVASAQESPPAAPRGAFQRQRRLCRRPKTPARAAHPSRRATSLARG